MAKKRETKEKKLRRDAIAKENSKGHLYIDRLTKILEIKNHMYQPKLKIERVRRNKVRIKKQRRHRPKST
jgi:hypothetical protein